MAGARPQSPAEGIHIREDFYNNDTLTDGVIGQNRWELVALGNSATLGYVTASPYGVIKSSTAVTADGDGACYRLATDGLALNGKGGGIGFRCALADQIAGNNFRIGLSDSVTTTAPTCGIWVECDGGVLSLEADSAAHGDNAVAVAQPVAGRTLTGGTTMVVATMHSFEITWTGVNGQGGPRWVELSVDGVPCASVFCNLDDDEPVELSILHWQDTGGGLVNELDIDYIEFWQWR